MSLELSELEAVVLEQLHRELALAAKIIQLNPKGIGNVLRLSDKQLRRKKFQDVCNALEEEGKFSTSEMLVLGSKGEMVFDRINVM